MEDMLKCAVLCFLFYDCSRWPLYIPGIPRDLRLMDVYYHCMLLLHMHGLITTRKSQETSQNLHSRRPDKSRPQKPSL